MKFSKQISRDFGWTADLPAVRIGTADNFYILTKNENGIINMMMILMMIMMMMTMVAMVAMETMMMRTIMMMKADESAGV